jgi:nodulation protein E
MTSPSAAGGRRVAITGIGVVSALGPDRGSFWSALCEGRSGIAPLTALPAGDVAGLKFSQGAQAAAFDPGAHFDPKSLDNLDRFAQMALVSAREACADAAIPWTAELRADAAVVTGSCVGGQGTEDRGYHELYGLHLNRFHPMSIPKSMANAGASLISMTLELTGPAWTVSTACSSSNHAIGQAFHLVRSGGAEIALAGGSEAPFVWGLLKAWEAMRVVSPDTCRPFSKDRKGLILGEGAAMLVLEPLERAQARGARVYAEIAGFGMSSDAHHITMPSSAGAAKAMRAALRDAGMSPEQVGYINAHGTGTAANDATETEAIRLCFGAHAGRLAVSSTKSMHGHALGAAGALEAAATVLALHNGILPPTANFSAPDPACDLDVIPNKARARECKAALSNSFAFGGLNAVLAFRR